MEFSTNFFISSKESRIENNKSFYGSFHIGPFEPGQSLTIANALRRTLLSELKGLAITGVEIDGVLHEYSNLIGVKDSVLDILLNLKEIVLRKRTNLLNSYLINEKSIEQPLFNTDSQETKKQQKNIKKVKSKIIQNFNFQTHANIKEEFLNLKSFGYLKVKGPGVVRASDLRLPPNIQCVDPNQYIATLTEDGFLNIKLIIEEGQKFMEPNHLYNPIAISKIKNMLISNIDKLIGGRLNSFSNQKYKESLDNINLTKSAFAEPLKSNIVESTRTNVLKNIYIDSIKDLNNFGVKRNLLRIDAVFNPVTKVNYIIEINENERINSYFENINHLETSLDILSSSPLKKIKISQNKKLLNTLLDLKKKNLKQGSGQNTFNQLTNKNSAISSSSSNKKNDSVSLSSLVGFIERTQRIEHKIILEIWTNGSIHPRQALQMALNNLVNVFTKLQRTQVYTNFMQKNNYLISENNSTVTVSSDNRPVFERKKQNSNIIFNNFEINNTYSLSRNTKDVLFQKWLYKYLSK